MNSTDSTFYVDYQDGGLSRSPTRSEEHSWQNDSAGSQNVTRDMQSQSSTARLLHAREGASGRARQASVSSRASTHSRSLSESRERSPTRRSLLDPAFDEELGVPAVPVSPAPPSNPPDYWHATRTTYSTPRPSDIEDAPESGYGTTGNATDFRIRERPEDMGGPREPLLGRSIEGEARNNRICSNGNRLAKCMIIFCVILIGVGFVVELAMNMHNKTGGKELGTNPGADGGKGPDSCPSATLIGSATFTFNGPREFIFVEMSHDTLDQSNRVAVALKGQVHIRPMAERLESDIRVDIGLQYSHSAILSNLKFNTQDNGVMEVFPPSHIAHDGTTSTACLIVEAIIWVSPRVDYEDFTIATESDIDIIYHPGMILQADTLALETRAGNISLPKTNATQGLQSRDITVETKSGRIEGTYPLYDSLTVKSNSGSIQIDIDPKPADKSKPKSARLDISDSSGIVQISYLNGMGSQALSSIPERDYRSSITTNSGRIEVEDMLHGSLTAIKTGSGSIQADIVPCGDPSSSSDVVINSE